MKKDDGENIEVVKTNQCKHCKKDFNPSKAIGLNIDGFCSVNCKILDDRRRSGEWGGDWNDPKGTVNWGG